MGRGGFLLVLGLLAGVATLPADDPPIELARNAGPVPAADRVDDFPPSLRVHRLRVDPEALRSSDPLRGRLRAELFDDVSLVLRPGHPQPSAAGGLLFSATVEGSPGGRATLFLRGRTLVGAVLVPGVGEFRLGVSPAGEPVVREIDTSRVLACGGGAASFENPPDPPPAAARGGSPCPDDGSEIDLLVAYTEQARVSIGGAEAMLAWIDLVVAYTNQAYANSEIDTRWNVVETMEVPYVEHGDIFVEIDRLQIPDDGHLDEVPVRRDAVGADTVSLVVDGLLSGTWCGVARNAVSEATYNVVRHGCPLATLAHELGHNAGCAHEGCGLTYNRAHVVPGQFATIMRAQLSGLIQHHSNPDVLYQGTPTGVAAGQTCPADNARTINENAWALANLRCSFVDCNGNGELDTDDIATGASDDCNGDDIPDECQADCNGNGLEDRCDVDNGTSDDCDGDSVPDECQPDCNGNTVHDPCDIAGGTSSDCNQNGVPDECDLAASTSLDCNGNLVPDDCDVLWIGTSDDCDGNGVPDECEEDCNRNGLPDACDLATSSSLDCDANQIPDECDLAAGDGADVDLDGVPDHCQDCDDNGVLDTLDIGSGVWPDVDGNQIPDPCERVFNTDRSRYHLTIQLGLDHAGPGDTVQVEPGIYREAVDFGGKPVVLRSSGGPAVTVLDAGGLGRSVVTLTQDGSGQAGSSSLFGGILGFTLTGGVGNLEPGGERRGGGVHLSGSVLGTIQNCVIADNTADRGAGVYVADDSPDLSVSGTLSGSIVRGNFATLEGGGIYVGAGSSVHVNGSTLHGNAAGLAGGAIHGVATVEGSIVWQNGAAPLAPPSAATVRYSDVEGGVTGLLNIDADPRFVDALQGDYRVLSGSPCVDAVNAALGVDYLDLDQDAVIFESVPFDIGLSSRRQDGNLDGVSLADMGAHELPPPSALPPPPIPDGSGQGQPLTANRGDADGQTVKVSWDATSCPPERAKLLYGRLADLPLLEPLGAVCDIGGLVLLDPVVPDDLWFLVVADNEKGEEGSWGSASGGERGGSLLSGLCGAAVKNPAVSCP